MAKVRQRTWTIPGQRTKRKAWGFVTVESGKHRSTCLGGSCRGCQQVRQFKTEWTREDAENALAAIVLKLEQPKAPASGLTLSQAAERYLAARNQYNSLVQVDGAARYGSDRPFASHVVIDGAPATHSTAGRDSKWRSSDMDQTGRTEAGKPG